MAEPPNRDRAGERSAYDPAQNTSGKDQSDDFEVGYRKPPIATRFKKGQSGNPFGRPRKPKPRQLRLSDDPTDVLLEREAFRPVTIRENGKASKIPAVQGLMRVMVAKGLAGNRLAAKFVLEKTEAKGREHSDWSVDRYVKLAQLKTEGEQRIAECKKRNLPPPELLPHPDDIVLRANGEALVDGPLTREDDQAFRWLAAWRDHLVLLSAHSEKTNRGIKIEQEGSTYCWFMIRAISANDALPKRYQWPEEYSLGVLFLECRKLSKLEGEQRIALEQEELDKTSPVDRCIDPEIQKELKRITERLLKRRREQTVSS